MVSKFSIEVDRKTMERLKYLTEVLGKSDVSETLQWLVDVAYEVLRR